MDPDGKSPPEAVHVLFWYAGSRLFDKILPLVVTFMPPGLLLVRIVDPFGKKSMIPCPEDDGLEGLTGGSAGRFAIEGETGTHPPT